MSTDRPIDLLIPGLRPAIEAGGIRFLEATIEDRPHWVMALDEDLGGARAIHHHLAQLIEGALLNALSRPRPTTTEDRLAASLPLGGLHLLAYPRLTLDPTPALRAFGLTPSTLEGPRWDEIGEAFRARAGRRRWHQSFSARVRADTTVPEVELIAAHQALVEETDEPWGAVPGLPATRLLELAERLGAGHHHPTIEALDAVEQLFVPRGEGQLRWVFPFFFQGLCDLIGVVAAEAYGAELGWSVGEEEEDGFVPPPTFEVQRDSEPYVLPIAHHLIRWCIMPVQPGEAVPPLSAWLREQFRPE